MGSRSCSVFATVGELWAVTKVTLRGGGSRNTYWNTFGWALIRFRRYVLDVEHLDLAPAGASRRTIVLKSGAELSVIDNERDDAARVWFLVHGLSSNARLWDGVLSRLSSRGDRVIAVDQRGHGHSPRSSDGYEMATVADDLAELARSVAASERFLIGQSWGGNVVVECAARHPGLAGSQLEWSASTAVSSDCAIITPNGSRAGRRSLLQCLKVCRSSESRSG
ncbi:MAG: alpha/beta hydrolase [Actinobacteria bacterium]|nr:alpha/beta hydrolase [Actinomycetota bacterium]